MELKRNEYYLLISQKIQYIELLILLPSVVMDHGCTVDYYFSSC